MAVITVHIKSSNDNKFPVSVDSDAAVSELKAKIAEQLASTPNPTPAESLRLIFAGRVLKDEQTLSECKVADGHTIHMVRGNAPRAAPATPASAAAPAPVPVPVPAAAAAAAAAASTTPASSTGIPAATAPAGSTTAPANPFAALGGLPPAFGGMPGGFGGILGSPSGLPGNAGGMPGNMDPNLMANLMSNPAILASMGQLFSNPQFLDLMIASNPQLAQVMTPQMREMMHTEEFRRMISDPNVLRATMALGGMNGMNGMGGFGGMPGLGGLGGIPDPASYGGGFNPNAATPAADPTATGTAAPAPGSFAPAFNPALLQMLMNANAAPPQPQGPPEEIYQTQLRQLQEMGFYDAAENVRALTRTNGNVEAAIEWLFSHPPGRG
ncbi:uncharacterized protein BJ171DRAFT_598531 [Polychytrium aggregatum]|uniref:uncharacterized protein n=1 Tax=Polychytrium aggregatum TaxID=110093 RepID=UPI0022FDC6EF|nr:uncharacterized protein BJ171DRAFT_598531 [Polychytrium aggregatum]KAI9205427.1 hypothetical protein BJ171DRAFT_598531 [Polychytrium aggregatum]